MDDRYERGLKKLQEIDGEAGNRVIEALKDIAPGGIERNVCG